MPASFWFVMGAGLGYMLGMKVAAILRGRAGADAVLTSLALAALLSLPKPYGHEPLPEYEARMAVVAEAVATAATATPQWKRSPEELALALVVLAWYEGGLLKRVHAGNCAANECDPVRWGPKPWQITHRAASLWQLHATPLVPFA